MAEKNTRELADRLIAQDTGIAQLDLEGLRMEIMKSVVEYEQAAQRARKMSFIAFGAWVACLVAILPLEYFQLMKIDWVRPAWGIVGFVAMASAFITAGYHTRRRSWLKDKRRELNDVTLAEMRQEIQDLKRQVRRSEEA